MDKTIRLVPERSDRHGGRGDIRARYQEKTFSPWKRLASLNISSTRFVIHYMIRVIIIYIPTRVNVAGLWNSPGVFLSQRMVAARN